MEDVERVNGAVPYRALLSDTRLLIVLLVGVTGTLSSNVASPALPGVAGQFGVSDARVALVMTAFTVPTMLGVPITGVLADTYGRRRVVVPALLVYGVAGVAVGFVESFDGVLAVRAVQGVAYAGVMPLSVTILGDLYAGATGSAAQGVRVSVNGLSGAVVPLAVGALVAIAWNLPFLLYAMAVPVAIAVYVFLPETGTTGGSELSLRSRLRSYLRDFRVETRSPEIRVLLAGGFARDLVRLAVLTFVPLFAVGGLGTSTLVAGTVVGLLGLTRMIVSPLAGWIVAKISRTLSLVVALGVTAMSVLVMGVATEAVVLGVGVAIFGVGDGLFAPVLKSAVTDAADPAYRAGVVNGLQLLKSGAQSLSPVVFGVVLATLGYRWMFVSAGLVSVCYAAALVWTFR